MGNDEWAVPPTAYDSIQLVNEARKRSAPIRMTILSQVRLALKYAGDVEKLDRTT